MNDAFAAQPSRLCTHILEGINMRSRCRADKFATEGNFLVVLPDIVNHEDVRRTAELCNVERRLG